MGEEDKNLCSIYFYDFNRVEIRFSNRVWHYIKESAPYFQQFLNFIEKLKENNPHSEYCLYT